MYCTEQQPTSATALQPYTHDAAVQIEIFDSHSVSGSARHSVVRTAIGSQSELSEFLLNSASPTTRVISICAYNSLRPLQITKESLSIITTHHNIDAQLDGILLAFGDKPRNSEAGMGITDIQYGPGGTYDMSYLLRYAEQDVVESPWRIRQTGVYHRCSMPLDSESDLWIFLQPKQNSRFEQSLKTIMISHECSEGWLERCQNLEILLLSSYFGNWRWYLKDLSAEFEAIEDTALTLDLSSPITELQDGFLFLQRLQYLQDRVFPLTALLKSTGAIISALKENEKLHRYFCHGDDEIIDNPVDGSHGLGVYEVQLQAHLMSTEVLEKRIQGTLKLLIAALDLKSQATAKTISDNMLNLTKETVDDSATVRVVTFVTLIYLPASFVSSIFGMNLFTFGTTEGSGFQISARFWIFVAISVPLTVLTIGAWSITVRQKNKKRALDNLHRSQKKNEV